MHALCFNAGNGRKSGSMGFLACCAVAMGNRPQGSINFWDVPNLLLQKFPAPEFSASVKIQLPTENSAEQCAGLIVMGMDYSRLSLMRKGDGMILQHIICKDAPSGQRETITQTVSIEGDSAILQVQVCAPNAKCRFHYSLDGKQFIPIGEEFIARTGKWIGAKAGLYCVSNFESPGGGHADCHWFRIAPGVHSA